MLQNLLSSIVVENKSLVQAKTVKNKLDIYKKIKTEINKIAL